MKYAIISKTTLLLWHIICLTSERNSTKKKIKKTATKYKTKQHNQLYKAIHSREIE